MFLIISLLTIPTSLVNIKALASDYRCSAKICWYAAPFIFFSIPLSTPVPTEEHLPLPSCYIHWILVHTILHFSVLPYFYCKILVLVSSDQFKEFQKYRSFSNYLLVNIKMFAFMHIIIPNSSRFYWISLHMVIGLSLSIHILDNSKHNFERPYRLNETLFFYIEIHSTKGLRDTQDRGLKWQLWMFYVIFHCREAEGKEVYKAKNR